MIYRVSTLDSDLDCLPERDISRENWIEHEIVPDTRGRARMYQHLANSMGKRTLRSYAERASNDSASVVWSWIASSDMEHASIHSAQNLSPAALVDLTVLFSSLEVEVWLLFDLYGSDQKSDREDRLHLAEASLDDYFEARATSPRCMPVVDLSEQERRFPKVPKSSFPAFLAEAESTLTEPELSVVKERYTNGIEATELVPFADGDLHINAAKMLAALTETVTQTSEAQTLIAGYAAGLFSEGILVTVDIRRFEQRPCLPGHRPTFSSSDWDSLDEVFKPADAAMCALAVLGYGPGDQARMLDHEVAEDGTRLGTALHGMDVPQRAQRALQTQKIHRLLAGAERHEFLTRTTRKQASKPIGINHIANVIADMQRETGCRLRNLHAQRTVTALRWETDFGIKVKPL